MNQRVKGKPASGGTTARNNPQSGLGNEVVLEQICHLQQDTQLMRRALRELIDVSRSMLEVQQRQEQHMKNLNESIDNVEHGIKNMDKDMDVMIEQNKNLNELMDEHIDAIIENTTKHILAFQGELGEEEAEKKAKDRVKQRLEERKRKK